MKFVGCALGHSFIYGLHQHLSNSRQGHLISPQEVAVKLRLDQQISSMHLKMEGKLPPVANSRTIKREPAAQSYIIGYGSMVC